MVVPVSGSKDEGIVTLSTIKPVIPFPAIQHVIATKTLKPVVVLVLHRPTSVIVHGTEETFNAFKGIAFGITTYGRAVVQTYFYGGIRAIVSCGIIAFPSPDYVGACITFKPVIPFPAIQHVIVARANSVEGVIVAVSL